jgi:small subunit ribosomal protein S20
MPNIKAAQKWARQTERRTARNKDAKSRLKTLYKKGTAGEASAPSIESAFDKAAAKGVIHKNKAARKKARLAKALSKVNAPAAKAPKTRKSTSRKKA